MQQRTFQHCFTFNTLLFCLIVVLGIGLVGCANNPSTNKTANTLETIKDRDQLVVGVKYDSPPFGFMDKDNQLKGYEIELAKEFSNRLLASPDKVKLVQVQTATRIPTLQAKQVDFVLATMTITDERKKVVDFSKPYFQAHQGVLVKADSPIKTVADLADKNVIFVIGGTGEGNLKKAQPKAKLLGFKSSTEGFTAFTAGRADAFSTDDSILNGFMEKHCGLRLLDEKISTENYGIAFRKGPENAALKQKIEQLLGDAEKTGYLGLLKDKWIKTPQTAPCP